MVPKKMVDSIIYQHLQRGAKWFRFRLSIHHPLGFKDGTPTWRCWYIIPLDQRMSTPDFVIPSSPIPPWDEIFTEPRGTRSLSSTATNGHGIRRKPRKQCRIPLSWFPPPSKSPKKNRTRELCFSREVNVRKLRLQCWGGIYWSKGGVKWSYMLILWDERVATANCTLFNFFSGLFRMQEMLHSAGLVALFCFQILFSRRPFSGEFRLPTLWVLRNYWPAVFLNQVPSLINNKKHGFAPPRFLTEIPKMMPAFCKKYLRIQIWPHFGYYPFKIQEVFFWRGSL